MRIIRICGRRGRALGGAEHHFHTGAERHLGAERK